MDKQVRFIRRKNAKECVDNIIQLMRDMYKAFDNDIKVTIEPSKETRRQAQNRLIWVINNQAKKHLEEHHGVVEDAEDLHEYFVGKILPKRVVKIMGEPEIKRTRTSKLNVGPCSEYITKLVMYLEENYNMKVIMPEDLRFLAMCEEVEKEEQTDGL